MTDIRLDLTPQNFDPDESWERMLLELREALESDAGIRVETAPVADPETGAKGDPSMIGGILLALASTPAVVKATGAVNEWVRSLGNRKVSITTTVGKKTFKTEAKGYSVKDVERIMAAARDERG